MKLNQKQLDILRAIERLKTILQDQLGAHEIAKELNFDISLVEHYLDNLNTGGYVSFLTITPLSRAWTNRININLTSKGKVTINNPDDLIHEKENTTMNNNITFTGQINAPIGVLQNSDNNTINITQNNNQNIQEIINSLEFLEKEIQAFPEEEQQEALVYLEQLKTEIKESKNPAKIRTFFKGFLKIAIPLATLIINGADFTNNITDLATKFDVDISQIALPFK